jgi:hypothetical protein
MAGGHDMARKQIARMRPWLSIVLALALGVAVYCTWRCRSYLDMARDHTWVLSPAEVAAITPATHPPHVAAPNGRNSGELPNNPHLVPKILHQTYFARARVPTKVWTNISKFAPEYEHRFYDDAAAEHFLAAHFDARVLAAFRSFKFGAHKADLFRYAVLYVCGGVYLDIKTQLVQRIAPLFADGAITTVISRKPNEIYQGIVAAPPRKAVFLALIDAVVRSGAAPPYNRFIRDFMMYIRKDVGGAAAVKEGTLRGARHTYVLYSERCDADASRCEDGLDRYGWCCTVERGGTRVIKTRYADFPW